MSGSSNIVLGRDDNCVQGGEVIVLTKGSVSLPAQMNLFDLELIAAGDVGFASLANNADKSINEGTSIMAGGDIDITSQHSFTGCYGTETTLDTKFTLRYVL